jgi:C4-dicarboxylate-binding protein DctP
LTHNANSPIVPPQKSGFLSHNALFKRLEYYRRSDYKYIRKGAAGMKKCVMVIAKAFLLMTIVLCVTRTPFWICSPAYGETMVLRVSHQFPQIDPIVISVKYWTDLVEKRTEGRVKFRHYYSGSLVSAVEMFDGLRHGLTDVGAAPISFMAGKVPELSVLEIPNAIPGDKRIEITREIGPILTEIFDRKDVKYVWSTYTGRQLFATKDKLIDQPDDFKGLKIRAPGRGQIRAFQLWGANPVFVDIAETYAALQRGTVDGASMMYGILRSMKIYEVAPYITDCSFPVLNFTYVGVNKEKWDRLSEKDKRILMEAGNEAMSVSEEKGRQMEAKIKNQLKSMPKVHVHDLGKKEENSFLKLTLPMWDEARKGAGPLGNQLIDRLMKHRRF